MFRFTIRDVLWLTVVVGMGVGWWMDHQQALKLQRVMKAVGSPTPSILPIYDAMNRR